MSDYFFKPTDHEEAIATIKGKQPVRGEVFRGLLPELRSRAFAVAGIEQFDVLETIRDRVAELPAGGDWNTIKRELVKDISPYLVDPDADEEDRAKQQRAAERRAELLIRTHGFQAYQAASYEVMDRQRDVFPYWQYQSMGDHRVRATHAALDGVVLPAGSKFWEGHYPPWEWGCRCQVIPLMDMDVEELREAEAGLPLERRKVLEGQALADAESGRLVRGPNEIYDLRTPRQRQGDSAYHFDPSAARLTLDQLQERYNPESWNDFAAWAKQAQTGNGTTVWQWLDGSQADPAPVPTIKRAVDLVPDLDRLASISDSQEKRSAFQEAISLPADQQGSLAHTARKETRALDSGFAFVNRLTHPSLTTGAKVKIKRTAGRAHADAKGVFINGKFMPPATVAHELGHILEARNPELLAKSVAFRARRTAGEAPKWMGFPYGLKEITLEDEWEARGGRKYAGKVYQARGQDYATEIISMGIQRLYEDPAGFYEQDREYFLFVIDALRS